MGDQLDTDVVFTELLNQLISITNKLKRVNFSNIHWIAAGKVNNEGNVPSVIAIEAIEHNLIPN